jgi:hypothetical protein
MVDKREEEELGEAEGRVDERERKRNKKELKVANNLLFI